MVLQNVAYASRMPIRLGRAGRVCGKTSHGRERVIMDCRDNDGVGNDMVVQNVAYASQMPDPTLRARGQVTACIAGS